MSRHTSGPLAFKYIRSNTASHNIRIGTKQRQCDVDKCKKGATWAGCVLGWDIGIYCTQHKQEMLDVTDGILHPDPIVEVAA